MRQRNVFVCVVIKAKNGYISAWFNYLACGAWKVFDEIKKQNLKNN